MFGIDDAFGVVRARVRMIVGVAMAIALIGALGWGWRNNALRSHYKGLWQEATAHLDKVTMVIEDVTGARVKYSDAPGEIRAIAIERDNARAVVKLQTASIDALAAEGERLKQLSERNRELAEATIRQRDIWIKRAEAAETRTERRSAELELEECNAVLDALYRDGF